MSDDVYRRLARHLDNLPGGFPPTESGVELRILRRLFTPEEAGLAIHLSLIAEESRVVARRAGISVEEAAARLAELEKKGLIFAVHPRGREPLYMAAQFVVGIWEYQVARLTPELARDMQEYMPSLMKPEIWKKAPQMRTVPVNRSVTPAMEVLDYERAEQLVRAHKRISVAPCICRKEKALLGHSCGKPLEVCMAFGAGADYYARNGQGRFITQEEALAILATADEAGLVLQPGNAKNAVFICACCGDCCGVLTTLKRYPQPGRLVAAAFAAAYDADACTGCGICLDRCQMEALTPDGDLVALDLDRCIGCGLCASTCPTGALTLARKPESQQPRVFNDLQDLSIQMGKARGKMGIAELMGLQVRSTVDRLIAPK